MSINNQLFDQALFFGSGDVKLVVSAACYELVKNTEIDFVKLDNHDEMQFIFKNPNDKVASAALERLEKKYGPTYYRRRIPGNGSYIVKALKEQINSSIENAEKLLKE